jgi:hypothetical protein
VGERVKNQRVCVGRDVRVLAEVTAGIEIEGETRLRPGHPVEIVQPGPANLTRTAVVWTWHVARVGSGGPTYRGFCRWT